MNKKAAASSNSPDEEARAKEHLRRALDRARAGDEEAFGEVVKAYHQRLHAVVYRFVSDEDDAHELAQQTWIKAWRKLDTFKGKSEFFTWLYRIATYVCLDFVRKKKREREEPLLDEREPARARGAELPFSSNPRPDRQLEHREIRERFERALEELSPEHRMALVLREVEGLSYDQIARAMKCRRGTVMSRLFYARKKMQEFLGDVRGGD